ncbi:MAG: Crp/Fnr family transcriptional regulator [Nitrospirae bacterium]|nr:Crp/Fnr family transcriptional regulator [Nitrospirota bacterium]
MGARVTEKVKSGFIPRVGLFRGVGETAMEAVIRPAKQRRIARGVFYFHQGDPARRLLILREGKVKFCQANSAGRQVTLKIIGPGQVLGSMAILGDETYPFSAQALTATTAWEWDSAQVIRLMNRFPPIAMNALRIVLGRLEEMQKKYRYMATERVELRLARVLARLAEEHGKPVQAGIVINLPLTRQELAEMAGTTLFTVSRILNQWKGKGFVRIGRGRVMLAAPHQPKDFVDRFLPGLPVS